MSVAFKETMCNIITFEKINNCKNINRIKSSIFPEMFYKLKTVLSALYVLFIVNFKNWRKI